jgi:riboflavin kinase/FMN adenylyltransferase
MSVDCVVWDGFAPVAPEIRGRCLSIGNFDGVHRGHAELIRRLGVQAGQLETAGLAVTFDPHPVALLRPEYSPPLLTTTAEKVRALKAVGADAVLVLQTSAELLRLSAVDFYHQVLRAGLAVRGLVEGQNFCFGRNRQGTVTVLQELAGADGVPVDVVPPVTVDGQPVSSSRIRDLLHQGDVVTARLLLGRPYALTGQVVVGQKRGRMLGFPTANLASVLTVIPAEGVYAGRAEVGGQSVPAAIHVGTNPTFGDAERKIEVHLIGFAGELYGRQLSVHFLRRLRPTRRFASADGLVAQLRQDVSQAAEVEP